MVEQSPPSYPRLSANAWWKIRQRFQQSMPSTVTTGYLVGLFDCTEASANNNYLRHLKAMGLVSDDNKATDRAVRWRNDEDYKAVCQEILESTYPAELRESQPCPEPDKSAVARWFSRTTRQGELAAGQMTSLYSLLCRASVDDKVKATTSARSSNARTANPRPKSSPKSRPSKPTGEANESGLNESPIPMPGNIANNGVGDRTSSPVPTLHIDVQIHISPDARLEQIDQIFKIMATHLYRSEPEAGR